MSELLGPEFHARYRLRERLGAGASAQVFRATQLSLSRDVAVKIYLRTARPDPRQLLRFATEADALSRLSHPGVVRILEHGEEAGQFFMVMELVEGPTLRQLRNRGWVPDPGLVAVFGCHLLEALAELHDAGILHRDLKPENLFVVDGRPRIGDLGLATIDGEETAHTTPGFLVGTPVYLAPELYLDGAWSIRSDLYTAGLILYEMVIGRLPHTLDRAALLNEKQQTLPPLADRVPVIDARIAAAIERAVAVDPAIRPASAREMLDELRRAVKGARTTRKKASPAGPPEPPIRIDRTFKYPSIAWFFVPFLGLSMALGMRGSSPRSPASVTPAAASVTSVTEWPSTSETLEPALIQIASDLRSRIEEIGANIVLREERQPDGTLRPRIVGYDRIEPRILALMQELIEMVRQWDAAGRRGREWMDLAAPLFERFFGVQGRLSRRERERNGYSWLLDGFGRAFGERGPESGPYRLALRLLVEGKLASYQEPLSSREILDRSATAATVLESGCPAAWRSSLAGIAARVRVQLWVGRLYDRRVAQCYMSSLSEAETMKRESGAHFLRALEIGRELQARLPSPLATLPREPGFDLPDLYRDLLECWLQVHDMAGHHVRPDRRKEALAVIAGLLGRHPVLVTMPRIRDLEDLETSAKKKLAHEGERLMLAGGGQWP